MESIEEQTEPGKFFMPHTDIHETAEALIVTMEMPGVEKGALDIQLEKNVLAVEGRVDFDEYEELEPLYTEYNVGHFRRSFRISSEIDQSKIAAGVENGVLTLHLPKAEEQQARKIAIN